MSNNTREHVVPTSESAPEGATATQPGSFLAVGPETAGAVGFELLGEIGRGGMGVVYCARDRSLDREVAVKILQDQYAPASGTAARFVDEARITGQLQHPGIPAVYQVGTWEDGRPFLAMKLIKGRNLDDLLKATGPHPTRWLSEFEHICQALGYAHARSVIHRDLKPQNVMVGAFGEVQVMDWGLAKVLAAPGHDRPAAPAVEQPAVSEIRSLRDSDGSFTQAGSVLGTPAFMPPEQAAGELDKIDCRSDVFGLGAILCALLTGHPPYSGRDAQEMRVKAVRGATEEAFARLDDCGAEPDVIALCKRCLAFAPADRPANANAVAACIAELRTAADTRAAQAERDRLAAAVRGAEQARRRRALMWSAAVVIAVLGGGVIVSLVQAKRAREAEAATAAQLGKTQEAEAAARANAEELDATLRLITSPSVRSGQEAKAVEFYQRLLAIRQRVANENPADLEAQSDLAEAYGDLGSNYWRLGQTAQARDAYNKKCALYRLLIATTADNEGFQEGFQQRLADAYRVFASLAWEREEKDDAISHELRAIEAYDRVLAIRPTNSYCLWGRCDARGRLGEKLRLTGKTKEARDALQTTVSDCLKLKEIDPAQVRDHLARAYEELGLATRELGELEAARESFQNAIREYEQLQKREGASAGFDESLVRCHDFYISASGQVGDWAAALKSHRELVAIRRRALDANPKDANARRTFVTTLLACGAFAEQTPDYKGAADYYEQALEAAAKLDRPETHGLDVDKMKRDLADCRARRAAQKPSELAPPPRAKPEK